MLYYNITQSRKRQGGVVERSTGDGRGVGSGGWRRNGPNTMNQRSSQCAFGRLAGFQQLFYALLTVIGLNAQSVLAQPFRMQAAPVAVPPTEAQQAFQAQIADQARFLASDDRFRHFSDHKRQALIEFATGNVLVATLHQLGLALVAELNLPVLAGAEKAADDFAILMALELGKSHFSDRILMEAAKGWFTTMRLTRAPDREHVVNVRRASRMVCLMFGADAVRFKALADETALPKNLQRNCGWDYDRALRAWEIVLRPHRPQVDQSKTRIDVSYGPAVGNLAIYPQLFGNLRVLEMIAEATARQVTWRAPLLIEMRSCGVAGATWDAPTRTLRICYEMADAFAALYRDREGAER